MKVSYVLNGCTPSRSVNGQQRGSFSRVQGNRSFEGQAVNGFSRMNVNPGRRISMNGATSLNGLVDTLDDEQIAEWLTDLEYGDINAMAGMYSLNAAVEYLTLQGRRRDARRARRAERRSDRRERREDRRTGRQEKRETRVQQREDRRQARIDKRRERIEARRRKSQAKADRIRSRGSGLRQLGSDVIEAGQKLVESKFEGFDEIPMDFLGEEAQELVQDLGLSPFTEDWSDEEFAEFEGGRPAKKVYSSRNFYQKDGSKRTRQCHILELDLQLVSGLIYSPVDRSGKCSE